MGLLDILQQYAAGAATDNSRAEQHFDEVVPHVPPHDLGQGLATAFRSDATPAFGQMVGQLFGNSDPQQRAGLLNQLIQSLGPGAAAGMGGGLLGSLLGTAAGGRVTPEQASHVSPDDVGQMAAKAENHDPSIIDQVSSFYSRHPTLVKTLGAVALSAVMGHLQNSRR